MKPTTLAEAWHAASAPARLEPATLATPAGPARTTTLQVTEAPRSAPQASGADEPDGLLLALAAVVVVALVALRLGAQRR